MKVICGKDRITLEPETNAERSLLMLYASREGQEIVFKFDEYDDLIDGKCTTTIYFEITFNLITEDER